MEKHLQTALDLAQQPGESDDDWIARVEQWINGDDVRTKVDLREWTGSLPFHLNREPIKK